MKSFDTEIKKYTNKVRLKANERDALRARILTYMEYHPLPRQSVHEAVESIASEPYISMHLPTWLLRSVGVFAMVVVVVVPFAAERAVPGDVLYPIKTQVNEGIRQQLANSPYERVVLETQLLERRIAEARLLASEGKLTHAMEVTIAETVKEHADAAQEGIAALRIANADEAAIAEVAFGSALEVQTAVLDVEVGSATTSPVELVTVVREAQADALAAKGSTTPSFAGVMARVELETTRAHELLASIDASLTDIERQDMERRLDDINRRIVAAQEHDIDIAEAEVPTDVDVRVDILIDALGLTQKLIVFMTDIDVSATVALETLVPIMLTDTERIAAIELSLVDITELREGVVMQLPNLDATLAEKVVSGLQALDGYTASTTEMLTIPDVDAAEDEVTHAQAVLDDILMITKEVVSIQKTSTSTVPVMESVPEVEVLDEDGTDTASLEGGGVMEEVSSATHHSSTTQTTSDAAEAMTAHTESFDEEPPATSTVDTL